MYLMIIYIYIHGISKLRIIKIYFDGLIRKIHLKIVKKSGVN